MAEKTIFDQLNTNVDSYETRVLNATTVYSFQATGPNGEIIFDSTQQTLPGFIADTASLAFTASTAPLYLPLAGGTITGNLTVTGTTTLNNVVSVTSSYSSGSTVFGDAISDTHRFTGSVFITGSSVTWNNSTLIASNITSSMSVASASQALTASYFNGSVTSASYAATASFLQGTASQALTASKISITNLALDAGTYFPMFANNASGPVSLFADAATYTYQPSTNILTVTSSLALGVSASSINSNTSETYDNSNMTSISWDARRLSDSTGNGILNWEDKQLIDTNAVVSIDWNNRDLYDDLNALAVRYTTRREMYDTTENVSLDWGDRRLIANDGATISLDWTTPGSTVISGGLNISGSLTLNNSNISTAWTSYTPVWTAASVNPVINNGTIEGWYKLVGKTCFVRGNIAMGSTTTFGSGEWYISMPFTASHADAILMTANLLDNTTAWYNAVVNGARAGFNYKAPLQYQAVGGTANDVNATQPFTWASSDRFIWNGSFEIA
jgi:hypothetical protein